jgi:hypothetical protein
MLNFMKKLLFAIIIIVLASSCNTYRGVSNGSTRCGVWYPAKFEKDRRMQAINRGIRIQKGWDRNY